MKAFTPDYVRGGRRRPLANTPCYIQSLEVRPDVAGVDYALGNTRIGNARFQVCNPEGKRATEAHCCFLQQYITKEPGIRRARVAAEQLLLWKITAHRKYMEDYRIYYWARVAREDRVLKQVAGIREK